MEQKSPSIQVALLLCSSSRQVSDHTLADAGFLCDKDVLGDTLLHIAADHKLITHCIARAERDGTRTETRFRLSPKRTSPFKSVGASVQSTAGSRGVRISLSNAG